MKRALIIAAAVIFVIATAIGVYFLFFSGKGGTLSVGTGSFPGSGAAGNGAASVTLGQGAGTVVAPHLIKITDGPVAPGFAAIPVTVPGTGDASTSPRVPDVEVRYVDRASGNTYGFDVHGRILSRFSNKTLPGIQKASWVPDGSMVYVQYLSKDVNGNEGVATYALPASQDAQGFSLEDGLSEAIAAGSTTVLTLLPSTTGTIATVAKADGTGAKTLFTSLLSQLFVKASNAGYFAYTPASAQLDGYAFAVNGKTGAFTRLLGPLRGLSILPSPSGKQLLYSYVDSGTPHLALFDTTTHAAVVLPLGTFAEKCAWASDSATIYCAVPTNLSGTLPDDWYQGALVTSDRFWRVDTTASTATLVFDPNALAKTPIDGVSLTPDKANDTLTFMDKASGSLWVYDL